MYRRKCLYTRSCDSEEDEIVPKLFCEVGSEVKYKEIPTNGEEYLLKVQEERNKCKFSSCDKDFSQLAKNQTYFMEELPQPTVPEKLKPTIEWQNVQIADFSEMRMYLSRLANNKSKWPETVKQISFAFNDPIQWKKLFKNSEPTLSCLFGLKYTVYDIGLETLTEILDEVKPGQTMSHETGRWIYALLACIKQNLQSDSVSILRDLARKCAEIRSRLDEDDENAYEAAAPLSLFICIVGRYFGQYDLAD